MAGFKWQRSCSNTEESGERVEKMMMNQSRCGMLLLVDQLRRRDVEKWGLLMLNITSVE